MQNYRTRVLPFSANSHSPDLSSRSVRVQNNRVTRWPSYQRQLPSVPKCAKLCLVLFNSTLLSIRGTAGNHKLVLIETSTVL